MITSAQCPVTSDQSEFRNQSSSELRETAKQPSPTPNSKADNWQPATGNPPLTIISIINEKTLICSLPECRTRNDAEALRGTKIYALSDSFPEADDDEFYFNDLIGYECYLENGSRYGVVVAVHNYGASDILEILPDGEKESRMFAFTEQTFPHIDLTNKKLTIAPPEEV